MGEKGILQLDYYHPGALDTHVAPMDWEAYLGWRIIFILDTRALRYMGLNESEMTATPTSHMP